MPEDLPRAVIVLLWLLIGLMVFGYLLMAHTAVSSLLFAVVFYGAPVLWTMRKKSESAKTGPG
ncbi:MAG TPA: hypothetical protein VIM41_07390 [Gammaproteobacteria bacterium]